MEPPAGTFLFFSSSTFPLGNLAGTRTTRGGGTAKAPLLLFVLVSGAHQIQVHTYVVHASLTWDGRAVITIRLVTTATPNSEKAIASSAIAHWYAGRAPRPKKMTVLLSCTLSLSSSFCCSHKENEKRERHTRRWFRPLPRNRPWPRKRPRWGI